ncbi:hypothetical protein FUSO6_03290, partial [Fusobacterium necrophorum DAB]|uniref:autotransporter-associated N-terminal domain-containing protein n=1 Tax=Fusobacterium necrophorum TaxID=859 RepID=UPI000461D07D
MVRNQLKEVEKNLRYIAKRDKSISFSIGLALLYLMLGVNAFSEEIGKREAEKKAFSASRQEIGTSTDTLSETLKRIKEENEKKLKGANLELIQLMEQGDQVVKSPWASWQFGINYFYSDHTGRYKGRGDKSKRYPYEGIFTRSNDLFERYTSLDSSNYSKLKSSNNSTPSDKLNSFSASKMATTSLRKEFGSKDISEADYGITSIRRTREPLTSFEVSASISPRTIEKTIEEPKIPSSITFNLPEINVTTPAAPTITSNIPVVNVGAVQSKTVNPPVLPKAVTFNLPEINVTSPVAPTITSNIPVVNEIAVQGKEITPPVVPKTIAFNLPKIEISQIAAPNITPNIPDIETPKIKEKTINPPELPNAISFNPGEPDIVIPATPSLPEPPTFKVIVAADWNNGISSGESGVGRIVRDSNGVFQRIETINTYNYNSVAGRKDYQFLNYTWSDRYEKEGLAFKWFDGPNTEATNYFNGSNNPTLIYGVLGTSINEQKTVTGKSGTSYTGLARTVETEEIDIDSYNNVNNLKKSINNIPIDRNKQYFLVGGSRAIEFDSAYGGSAINVGRVNLNGILNLGMVSQGSARGDQIINDGTITDEKEKNEAYIKELTIKYDTKINGSVVNNALKIYGPGQEVYNVSLDSNGYVGYKIGMALVPENDHVRGISGASATTYTTVLNNKGEIKFNGGHSIGEYVYLPTNTGGFGSPVQTIFNGTLKNEGTIELSGKSSHGMKLAARTEAQAAYENKGTINLLKKEEVAADGSTGMALMTDSTVKDVNLEKNVAKNTGTINLKDVKNSSGMFINIDSNMTNKGIIAINSTIAKNADSQNQEYNIGMRADSTTKTSDNSYTSPEIINDTDGKISLDGTYAIGMSAKGSTSIVKATNKGTITSTDIKNGIGIFNLDGEITNEGTIQLTGTGNDVNNIGIFLKKDKRDASGKLGTNSNITVKGDGSTGILLAEGTSLEYNGNLTVNGNKVSGIVVTNGSKVTEASSASGGTIKVGDPSAAGGDSVKGSYGLVVKQGGNLTLSKTETTVNVTGEKSVGIFSEGEMNLGKTNVTTADGAVNFFAKDNGIISINGGESKTGQKSLLFYQAGTNPKILIKNEMKATIEGGTDASNRGTAFFYQGDTGSGYSKFDSAAIGTWKDKIFKDTVTNENTLGKLTLNMESGSRLFVASHVAMNLSNTDPGELKNSLGLKAITGTNYKTFMLYDSQLTVDKDVDLNDDNSDYKKLEISNSSVINNNKIEGTQNGQTAIAQENNKSNKDAVTITNNKEIKLSGEKSTGIYAKYGKINNAAGATITTTGKNSAGIYALNNTEVKNNGTISVGEDSTGIFYSDSADTVTSTALKNEGTIILNGKDAVGMYYEPRKIGATNVKFENAAGGKITATKDSAVGMYAKVSKDNHSYVTMNAGTIELQNGTKDNPTIGMYTNAEAIGRSLLKNEGTITVGNSGIGMLGYEETTSGNIKVGDSGIALFTKGGSVNVEDKATITVGNSDAVGIYATGNNSPITSAGKYVIGNESYGIVNKGTGNTITVTNGTANLTEKGKFIYSTDTTGKIENKATITATGSGNYGIYSSGEVKNTGNMSLETGTGNIGILVKSTTGKAENSGNIKVGASTAADRSIGIVAIAGTAKNTGTIEVTKANGLGLYAKDNGTVENTGAGKIIADGDSTIGAYAADSSNIKLTDGEISVKGKSTIGYYLNQGQNSEITTAKINVEGDKSTGVFVNDGGKLTSYSGETTVTGDGVYGLVVGQNSTIGNANAGKLTVTGTGGKSSNQTTDRGSVGLVVQSGGKIEGIGLTVDAKVAGQKSVGVYSAGNASIGAANITTSEGAVNFFADNGTISINGPSTVVTGTGTDRGSLLFYTRGNSGKILVKDKMTATVQGDEDPAKTGTAFLFEGSGTDYTSFTTKEIGDWAKTTFGNGTTSTLDKLTLEMKDNSRLFVASNVSMNLSDTSSKALSGALGGAKINGTNYKSFMLYDSKLKVDQNVDLDDSNSLYKKLEISSSSIENDFAMTGKSNNQVAIAQENVTGTKNRVTLTNNKSITLGGEKSTGIYAKYGMINNAANATITTTGKNSAGIYALKNTAVTNKGTISVGENSTGIFYSDVEKSTTHTTETGLKNEGIITLTGTDAVGMYYEPGNIVNSNSVTFENAAGGKITATSNSTEGMYAKVSKDKKLYDTINAGTVELKDGTTTGKTTNPTIGMYTDATTKGTNPLKNTGTITVGNHGIGMYGFEETTSGTIKVGNSGIALYTQGGPVNVESNAKITVGNSDAVGIYAKGNNSKITSKGSYEIGKDSYGIIVKGTNNTVNVTAGTAKLSNRGKFIYSEDKT